MTEDQMEDDDLDLLLGRANPVGDDDVARLDIATQHDAVLAWIAGERSLTASARGRRTRRSVVAVFAAAAVIATGGVAAAQWTSSHTGWFGDHAATESDHTEYLNLGGDDFTATARQLGSGIPFPAGDSVDEYVPVVFPREGRIQAGGVRFILSVDAACAWQGFWLQSNAEADAARQAAATRVLTDVPHWTAIASHDGGGTVAMYRQVAAAATAGDPGPVEASWSANCTDLPRAWKST